MGNQCKQHLWNISLITTCTFYYNCGGSWYYHIQLSVIIGLDETRTNKQNHQARKTVNRNKHCELLVRYKKNKQLNELNEKNPISFEKSNVYGKTYTKSHWCLFYQLVMTWKLCECYPVLVTKPEFPGISMSSPLLQMPLASIWGDCVILVSRNDNMWRYVFILRIQK